MNFSPIFQRFMDKSPISVMARALMERAFDPEKLDRWFEKSADRQYTRELLFSTIFGIMTLVVAGTYKSVHAAYQALKTEIPVSVKSLYNKLNGLEPEISANLVRYAARQAKPVIEKLGGAADPLLPGHCTKMLDGNCIESSEHRIKPLRSTAAGALPGKSLVVYDPALRLPIDVFPCEDGHAQERSLLADVLSSIESGDVWIADRNFCVIHFLFGIANKKAFFIIRQHGNLPYQTTGKMKRVGQTETGTVYEEPITISDESGRTMTLRRIRIHLDKPTRDGDHDIFIIANVPRKAARATKIAELYRKRWKIETVFQELKKYLKSEINSLGYPKAALFTFCVALVCYIILAMIQAALASEHGSETVEEKISGYYLADEIEMTYRGMIIAVEEDEWRYFRDCSNPQLVRFLKQLAGKVNLSGYLKHPRGPKKPKKKRESDKRKPHISTARLLAGII